MNFCAFRSLRRSRPWAIRPACALQHRNADRFREGSRAPSSHAPTAQAAAPRVNRSFAFEEIADVIKSLAANRGFYRSSALRQ